MSLMGEASGLTCLVTRRTAEPAGYYSLTDNFCYSSKRENSVLV